MVAPLTCSFRRGWIGFRPDKKPHICSSGDQQLQCCCVAKPKAIMLPAWGLQLIIKWLQLRISALAIGLMT